MGIDAEQPISPDGDAELFEGLYGGLRRFAAVVGPGSVDPDDLVQEAVARALRAGPLAALSNPGAYLRTAIVRLAANERRGAARRERALRRVAADPPSSDGAGAAPAGYPSDVAELDRLAPMDRAVLCLAVMEGRPHREIAALVGSTEAAVRKRLSRALSRLRAESGAESGEVDRG